MKGFFYFFTSFEHYQYIEIVILFYFYFTNNLIVGFSNLTNYEHLNKFTS